MHDQQTVDTPAPDSNPRGLERPSFVQRVGIGTLFGVAALAVVWFASVDAESRFQMHRLVKLGSAAGIAGVLVGAIPFRRRWLTLAASVPTLVAVIAVAGVVQSIRDAPPFHFRNYECNGPPGQVSSATLRGWSDGGEVHVLSGRIVPVERRLDPKWIPTAAMLLVPAEGTGGYGVKLAGPEYEVSAVYHDRAGERTIEDLDLRVPAGSPLPFELRWAGGTAVLWLGDGSWLGRREIDFHPQEISLLCSTGRTRFEELWRDRFPVANPAELGPVQAGSMRSRICQDSDELSLNVVYTRRDVGAEATGVSISNCESSRLRLVDRKTIFTLQERRGEVWATARDLTPYLCCDRRLGILDPDESWALSGMPAHLDPTRTFRFELDIGARTVRSKEFTLGIH